MKNPVARVAHRLPDTTTRPGMPASPEAIDFIITQFTAPILQVYNGGAATTEEENVALLQIYSRVLTGFDPGAYVAARDKIFMERTDRFRPTPAELRECLTRVHREQPRVQAVALVEAFREHMATGKQWCHHGPFPGREGCLMPADVQAAEWGLALEKMHYKRPKPWDLYRELEGTQVRSTADPRCPMPLALRRKYGLPTNAVELDAVTPASEKPAAIAARQHEAEERRLAQALDRWQPRVKTPEELDRDAKRKAHFRKYFPDMVTTP